MNIETDYLAEEWLDFLKEEVEPKFPGIYFEKYEPPRDPDFASIRYAERILVVIDDKLVFKNGLKGQQTNKRTTEVSLQRYVYHATGKVMILR